MSNQKTLSQSIFAMAVMGAAVWYFFGGGLERQAGKDLANIEAKVASDAVTQYGMAKRSGSAIDICSQAGMVAAAFLQAKDEQNYSKWKKVESADCKAAGMPGI